MTIGFIVVRIKDNVKVIFEDEFLNKKGCYTQNVIIDVLKLLYDRKDFEVTLHSKIFEKKEDLK